MSQRWQLALCCAATFGIVACSSNAPAGAGGANPPTATAAAATVNSPASTIYAYHWDLAQVTDARGAEQKDWRVGNPPKAARLTFVAPSQASPEGRVLVANLCNNQSAGFQLQGESVKIGPVMGTMRACAEPGLMALEQRLGGKLPSASRLQIVSRDASAPVALLEFADGMRWRLVGQPTADTRYGGKPEQIFLEIAPEKVACNHPLIRNAQCLQVREIKYNAAGLKQAPGPWTPMYESIDGFEHEAGVRNVLRIHRYERKNPPADASKYAYVLDMRVETELVRERK